MYKSAPQLARLGTIAPAAADGVAALAKTTGSIGSEPFASPVRDFYLTNPIARASAVMAEMSALKKTVSASQRLKAAE
jgi:NADH-quinone oxidoreductase subunit G